MSFGQESIEIKKTEDDQVFFKENNLEERKDYDDLFFRISLEESQKKQNNNQNENLINNEPKTKAIITNAAVENRSVSSIFETECLKNNNKTCVMEKNCDEIKYNLEEKSNLEDNNKKKIEENHQSFKENNDEISKTIDQIEINDNSFEMNFDIKQILSLCEEKCSSSK